MAQRVPLSSLWWAFSTVAHHHSQGGKSPTALWLNCRPWSHFTSLCFTVPSRSRIYSGIWLSSLSLFTLLQSVTVGLFISFPLSFLIRYF